MMLLQLLNIENRRCKSLLLIVLLGIAIFLADASLSHAKYAGHDSTKAYLEWTTANEIFETLNPESSTQATPHGGYIQTSVKCAVCHSTHRASSPLQSDGTSDAQFLLKDTGQSCLACHASWGSSPSDALIEMGQDIQGPHYTSEAGCLSCHGSVHGSATISEFAVVQKYNLKNESGILDARLNQAIASGNTNPFISKESQSIQMESFVTGFLCQDCHTATSRSVATQGVSTTASNEPSAFRTGHISSGASIKSCDSCHDMVGVATNSSAWPHGNRGIEVYVGRFDGSSNKISPVSEIADGLMLLSQRRYGLWMTAANFNESESAVPLLGSIADSLNDFESPDGISPSESRKNINEMLTDGVCIKCHKPDSLR